MKDIKKLEFRLRDASSSTDAPEYAGIINQLIDKVNELTEKVNSLNDEVACIHEWKLQKEGI
jgi:flagellar hook-associated protein FlgK